MKICESPNPFGESPIDRIFAFCSSVLSPEGKEQIGHEKSSRCIAEQLCEAVLHRPIIQDTKMLKATDERRRTRPKGESPKDLSEHMF
ncbi:hypothetical protein H5410_061426 [Solanum commersonii]|uniref:Uncharacterized protein n=1 Tax=Solanum commersonii TaxID=4109 RepID=A0A9J5W8U3_SOLCO|nr:hypothetical protein H5410_061426 [Solanum commersonii]